MKLLIVAQRVDRADPILGFFHRWIAEFARRCERVIAVGQAVGEFDLPSVTVLSLGKEQGMPRWLQILRFWRILWTRRREYDAAFVHMSPIWVVLGCPILAFLRKPVFLWYEVRRGGRVLRWAVGCARKVFSATGQGVPFFSGKTSIMGHGIDTDVFRPSSSDERDPHLLLTVGRLTPIKHHELFLETLAALPAPYRLFIAGGTVTEDDRAYEERLIAAMREHGIAERVTARFVRHDALPPLFGSAALFLHAGGGGLDKVLLEAMACGCIVLTTSFVARGILPDPCLAEPDTFLEKARALLALPPETRQALAGDLRRRVVERHSLPKLIETLVAKMAGG